MKYTTFSDRLNLCLDKEGFPPKNRGRIQLLAEMVGLTHRGASKWVNGETEPPSKKFSSLARKLNVNEQWLQTGEGDMLEISNSILNQIPSTQASVPLYNMESFLKNKKIEKYIDCCFSYTGNFFALTLDTEAMSPRFPKGCIIIFDTAKAKDGDFVLVNFPDYPSPIFRQLFIIGNILYLNAPNPKFDRLVLGNEQRILGKLVQAILNFD